MVLMASETESDIFDQAGPFHLAGIEIDCSTTNEDHRRSVAASLVQGTYVQELDRQNKREGPEALAPPWYEFFHYQLVNQLIDDVDSSIFGSIYKYMPPTSPESDPSTKQNPHYVIAFRGTLTYGDSRSRDIRLNLKIAKNRLHKTSRFLSAIDAVNRTVSAVGEADSNVWLAGHSLGAAIAILAGRTVAKKGIFLTTFLFNPPFVSVPLEKIKARMLKHGLRVVSSLLTAGLVHAINAKRKKYLSEAEAQFMAMSDWVPCLFVHLDDHICSEYKGYFEHRNVMEEIRLWHIEKLATQYSICCLVCSAIGPKVLEPFHLIPSANLTVNLTPATTFKKAHGIFRWFKPFKKAHGIHQWFKPDLNLESVLYKYKTETSTTT